MTATKDVVRRAGTTVDSPPRLPIMSAEALLVEYYRAWETARRRVAKMTLHRAELGMARVVKEATT